MEIPTSKIENSAFEIMFEKTQHIKCLKATIIGNKD